MPTRQGKPRAAKNQPDRKARSPVREPVEKTSVRAKVARTAEKKSGDSAKETIIRAATLHLMMKHGSLLLATGARQTSIKGSKVWIITVTLRYPTGHEGYVGDLLHDGEQFTFLTEQAVMDERIRKIAEDPEEMRKWNEFRDSTLRPGKA